MVNIYIVVVNIKNSMGHIVVTKKVALRHLIYILENNN